MYAFTTRYRHCIVSDEIPQRALALAGSALRTNEITGLHMDNDTSELNERIGTALAGSGSRKAAEILDARLASGSAVAEVRLGAGRDTVLMAVIASRIAGEPGLRALVVAPSDREVAGLQTAFSTMGGLVGLEGSTIGRDGASATADVAVGSLDAIASCVASGTLEPRDFGLVALSDLDTMADAANAAMLRRALGPGSSKRRLVAFSAELGPSHRAIARDLGGTVAELELEAEGQRARNAPTATYSVNTGDKPRLMLGLLAATTARPFAVFCDLRDTAEAATKALRSRGVSTEYVLGNLPRKRAVLDSVKAGTFDVLVLTDEGAAGLPGSWAAALVNWDLPLEGEPYLTRLEHLDATKDDARVYNFACDRYSFGLPAIERVLGTKLPTVSVPASMMVADTSGRAETTGKPEYGPKPKAESESGSDRRRGDDRRDDRRDRGDRNDRGGQYDGRNARAIQADIAAITGGKPSAIPAASSAAVGGTGPTEKPGKKRARKGRSPAGKNPAAGAQKPGAGEPGKRGADSGKRRDTSQPARTGAKRGKGNPGQRLADPYSVSMEERLRLYRERYGEGQDSGAPAKSGGSRPGSARNGGQKVAGRVQPDRASPPPAQKESASQSAPADRPRGLLGALKNLFGKKDE